ncbi:MAG: hypothetical protein A3F68_10135 [Acidobacteria bacterium RIFCSPLOWO2_12_FULL_54_10]|nr:MAG: hypothetical protein A3F68_10135 [Acidobacteria bacterium RIFCSPLOWO2_12_FULL_54_10]
MLKTLLKIIFLLLAPLLLAALGAVFIASDFLCHLLRWVRGQKTIPSASKNSPHPVARPIPRNASIVIPTWNGKDLLGKYLPTVLAGCHPDDEIIVVDNASTDGTAKFVRQRFPQVRLLVMPRNLGFGGGSNAGIQAARHPIVVLLNNDMRATPGFLEPLLAGFTDDDVFAVSAQIFFSDSSRRREETGLTIGSFQRGFLRVGHKIDDEVHCLYPILYAGGGSTAYDRDKFLSLGGFDPLFEPFYLEDTDLSYCAWRRGWKVLYQPASHLFHEHRATIAKNYSPQAIRSYLRKNYVLMVWKNIHRWRWLIKHLSVLYTHQWSCFLGQEEDSSIPIGAFLAALRQFPQALRARRSALLRSTVDDAGVFERLRPAVFRDLFSRPQPQQSPTTGQPPMDPPSAAPGISSRPLNILFLSPYSIYPPVHGGGVFMFQTIQELSKRHNVYVLTFVDRPEEMESNRSLEQWAKLVKTVLRRPQPGAPFSLRPNAEWSFVDAHFAECIEKMIYFHDIDLIQVEYTQLAQYRLPLRHTPQCLFEHDISFRSLQRHLVTSRQSSKAAMQEFMEWLRIIRYEIRHVSRFDAVFTCHQNEKVFLESFLNGRRPKIISGLRSAIDVSRYEFPGGPRQPGTLFFVGNYQHRPNAEGLQFFCRDIFPAIRKQRPDTRLVVAGAHPSEELQEILKGNGIDYLGQVEDIRDSLRKYSVFICPILSGAGIRVKLLEAFSSGIPVVSTSLGAEGLSAAKGNEILIADSPADFAAACVQLLDEPERAAAMAARARSLVERDYDSSAVGQRLEQVYYQLVAEKSRSHLSA